MLKLFIQLISLLCVALGQPAFFPWLGPLAASVGFALHWRFLEGLSLKNKGRASFLWFFSVQLIQLSWMANLQYQGIYILVLYVFLSAALALQFAFLTKVAHRLPRLDGPFMLALAGLWTLFEWSRLHVLCGFAFNFLGLSLSSYPLTLQMASIFGVLGLSFWVVLSNLAALQFLRTFSISHAVKWAVLILIPCLYGFIHIKWHDASSATRSILLAQTALLPSQKCSLRGKEADYIPPIDQWKRILDSISPYRETSLNLLALPEGAVPFGLDLYIYPLEEVNRLLSHCLVGDLDAYFPPKEVPFTQGKRVSNAYILQTLSNFFQAPIVAGLDYQEEEKFYNSAFYFQPGSSFPQRYDKRVLLPLAESMPFSFLTSLSKYYGIKDFFTSGCEAKVFSDSFAISPSICYEELFPSLIREGRKQGAELFVNLSNDGWYPSSKLPIQHFTQGLIRSVENGIPSIRACNTGVTAAVDSLGRVIAILQDGKGGVEHVSGCLLVKVPKEQHRTGFALWGETPLIVLCFFLVIWGFIRAGFLGGTLSK